MTRRTLAGFVLASLGFQKANAVDTESEGSLITSIGNACVGEVQSDHPDWSGFAAVFTPNESKVGSYGFVYFDNKKNAGVSFSSLPVEYLLESEKLRQLTTRSRGNWVRMLLRVRTNSDDYAVSYDFNEIDPWQVKNLSSYDDIQALIESLRPTPVSNR